MNYCIYAIISHGDYMEKEQIQKLINRKIDFHDMTKARHILNKSYLIESGKMESHDIKISLQKGSPVIINSHMIIGYDPLNKAFIDSNNELLQIQRPVEGITVQQELMDTRPNFAILGRVEWSSDIYDFNNIIGSLKIGEIFLPKHSAVFNFLNHTDETRTDKILSVLDGININIYDPENYVDNTLHEMGHLFWRTCLSFDERLQFEELFKYLRPSAIYEYSWERSDAEEVFCTIYKWYLKSILLNKSFLSILTHEEPEGYRLLNQVFERVAKSRMIDDIWELSKKEINDYLFPKIDKSTGIAFRKKGALEALRDIELPESVLNDIDSVQDGVTYVNFGKAVLPVKGNKLDYEILSKAGKDISKLHKKIITDKKGVVRTVWVKGVEQEKKKDVASGSPELVTFHSLHKDEYGFEKIDVRLGNKSVLEIQGADKSQPEHKSWMDYKAFRVAEIIFDSKFLNSGKFEKTIQDFANKYQKGIVLDEDNLDPEIVKRIKKMDHMVTAGGYGFMRLYPTGYQPPAQDAVEKPKPYVEPERETVYKEGDVEVEKTQIDTRDGKKDSYLISYKGKPNGGFFGYDQDDVFQIEQIDIPIEFRTSGVFGRTIQAIANKFERGLKLEIFGTGVNTPTRDLILDMKNYDAEEDINGHTYIRREKKSETDFSQGLMFFEKSKKNNTPINPDIDKTLDKSLNEAIDYFRDHIDVDNDTGIPFHFLDKKEQKRIINITKKRLGERLKTLQETIEKNPIVVRVNRDSLTKIVQSGELKNQWETGTSNGALSKESRTQWEKSIIKNGSDEIFDNLEYKNDAPPAVKPVYGYVDYPEAQDRLNKRVSQYGDVKIILKPEVKERATYTLGDSSNMQGAFTKGGISKVMDTQNEFRKNQIGENLDQMNYCLSGSSYVETQIFGGVDIKKDVQEIVVTEAVVWDLEEFKKEHGLQGVNVRYYNPGEDW